MHYYQFNIGDYLSHTKHLDLMEDLAYRRLLDLYYLHERPLNSGIASVARQIGMRDHENEVKSVLEEFFNLSDDGWINHRADKEIKHYHSKIDQASRAGKASAERRMNTRSTDVQLTNNQEPITNNHKPIKEKATIVATPEGVSQSVWDDFKTLRKAKKAPITQRAIDGLINEANKAGWSLEQALTECCVRGWQAFKAEWVADKPKLVNRFDVVTTTVPSKQERDPALVKLDEDSKKVVPPSAEMLEKFKLIRAGK
jgi:uncharacterized protein YdaU (DUF1376 family)